jgi:plastocyanin
VILNIGAEDSEGFTKDRLRMKAGETVTVVFKNVDSGSGEPHNWHLVTDECMPIGGDVCFTPIEEGPDTAEITFTILTPGEYPFTCDTHLTQMNGVLVVDP